jgi:hypothetical protein
MVLQAQSPLEPLNRASPNHRTRPSAKSSRAGGKLPAIGAELLAAELDHHRLDRRLDPGRE